jgi:hypothetical protein
MTERTFTLGPLPWSEEAIEHSYFADFRGVWAAIREHPGFPPHRDLAAVRQSLEILGDTVEELVTKIEAFDTAAKTHTFWNRPARAYFDAHVRSVRRAMFAATTAAVAWRDIVRAVGTHCVDAGHPLPGWDVHWSALTSRPEHQFVVDLRNCISHAALVTPGWQVRLGLPGPPAAATENRQRARFLLSSETLSECDKLSVSTRTYLKAAGDGVDLIQLFSTYMTGARSFHEWFSTSVSTAYEPALGEYRGYEAALRRIRARVGWRLLLSIANPSNFDAYLSDALSPDELEAVWFLPVGSRARADRVIEILDEEGACTPELRALAYKVLGVVDASAGTREGPPSDCST